MRIYDVATLTVLAYANPFACILSHNVAHGTNYYDHAKCFAELSHPDDVYTLFNSGGWRIYAFDGTGGKAGKVCAFCRTDIFSPWSEDVCVSTIG